ncbi:hypothetical protein EVAR_98838_1 [Eumeta japonica]|uniref:Uncharacterized protein n=1 Tax=Eumeta variegata TaxID=151549 RepID=A0A4C1YNL5_EUMVA|nr:hypothetical protein EVAR_98838_1 [Eumeta japonica]
MTPPEQQVPMDGGDYLLTGSSLARLSLNYAMKKKRNSISIFRKKRYYIRTRREGGNRVIHLQRTDPGTARQRRLTGTEKHVASVAAKSITSTFM